MDREHASVELLPDGVFISYQRSSGAYVARAIYQSLTQRQYDVFLDVEKVDSGRFENVILNELGRRPHFVVVLTPSTVTAIESASDWVRREIEPILLSDDRAWLRHATAPIG